LEYFNIIKSLHIIFVITWFAGLFYVPRLFIYFIEAHQKKNDEKKILTDQLIVMIERLWYLITWPSSILALIFGFWMLILVPAWIYENWMIAKLFFVLILVIYHLKNPLHSERIQIGSSKVFI
jgi:putative membrane protein